MQHYRQGDVLFIHIESIPEDVKQQQFNIIVEGETTGHAHRLVNGQILLSSTMAMYLACQQAAKVIHEEHRTIDLPVGNYLVIRQREYSPEEIRTVRD